MSTKHPLRLRLNVTLVWTLLLILGWLPGQEQGVGAAQRASDPSVLMVTTVADRADGNMQSFAALGLNPGGDAHISLREALTAANNTTGTTPLTIAFQLPAEALNPGDSITLQLRNPLPALTRGHTQIDGSTQPNAVAVTLDGGNNNRIGEGFVIASAGNEIRGLTITNFYNNGVLLQNGAVDNSIVGCRIEGNHLNGIAFEGAQVVQNRIVGSTISANDAAGVLVGAAANNNRIGGDGVDEGNRIRANKLYGIAVNGPATNANLIVGNEIVEHLTSAQASATYGIWLSNQSQQTLVARNLISGNNYGIRVDDSTNNQIVGNLIGVTPDGLAAQPNTAAGILLYHSASANIIGGAHAAARNVISANAREGMLIYGPANTVRGNYVGVGRDGSTMLGNGSAGIRIADSAPETRVEANIIAANGGDGLRADSARNIITGNRVGINLGDSVLQPNRGNGIIVRGADNTIGPANVVVNHATSGIHILGSNTQVISNTIETNRRGLCIGASDAQISDNTIRFNGITGSGDECAGGGGGVLANSEGAVVTDNIIHNNVGPGVIVLSGEGNRVQANSITNNSAGGIVLTAGTNRQIAAPTLAKVLPTSISGQACPTCWVEIFGDEGDEGRMFLGAVQANEDGQFAMLVTRAMLARSYVTATATDADGNTSPFATPFKVPPTASPRFQPIFIPLVQR